VAPLTTRPGHGLLRCPICRRDLTFAAGALICRNRHSFDLARDGYVNLLRNGRRAAAGGDTAAQLGHRASFLARGHFDAVAATIAQQVRAAAPPPDGRWGVLDAGCGTGHHLAGIVPLLGAPTLGLGLDLAKDAVRRASRAWPALAFAVADIWAEWPVRDAAADLVISAFAPKNFAEMSRVLRPGGWMALVYPGPDHLAELDRRFGLMRRHANKDRDYADAAARLIGPPSVVRIIRRAVLDATAVRDAVLMGPNARHTAPSTLDLRAQPVAVTFDLLVLFARKPAAKPRRGK
jgi:23S rRNA (guanine745-N1)-methyltransferase